MCQALDIHRGDRLTRLVYMDTVIDSQLSLQNGCAPVEFPDFTRGEWNKVKGFRHAFAQ